MEGFKLFNHFELPSHNSTCNGPRNDLTQENYSIEDTDFIVADMKQTIQGLVYALLGNDIECKWSFDYFPFTHPSYELEVFYNDKWVELLGCGVIENKILENNGVTNKKGWACGIGIERLAMLMFKIDDIRMLWTKDINYINSYANLIKNLYDNMDNGVIDRDSNVINSSMKNQKNEYVNIHKIDISKVKQLNMPKYNKSVQAINYNLSFFKINPESPKPNDVFDLIRDVAGELVESVDLKNIFVHPKKKMESNTYEIIFRPASGKITKEDVNKITSEIRDRMVGEFSIEGRW